MDFLAEDIREEGEPFAVYVANMGSEINPEKALDDRDAYMGSWDSEEEWAESFADETGMLESVPEHLRRYFDFQAWAQDAVNQRRHIHPGFSGGKLAVFHGR